MHEASDFKSFLAMPVRGYDFYEPWVERALDGDHLAFGNQPVLSLAETSASSGKAKLIPHNRSSLAAMQKFSRLVLLFKLAREPNYIPRFSRWMLVTASSGVRMERGLPIGFVSGLVYRHTYRQNRWIMLPTPEVSEITDWQQRIQSAATEALQRRVGTLFGVPAYLIHFMREASKQRPGGLAEVWPLLRTVYYSGTGIDSHRAELEQLAQRPLKARALYMATEAVMGAELDSEDTGLFRLIPQLAIFAFRESDEAEGRLKALWELELGRRYEVFISTYSGLFHYKIGDVLEVASLKPLLFRFAGRSDHEINLATEKISSGQAEKAMASVAPKAGVSALRFVVMPHPGGARRHLWVLEAAGHGRPDAAEAAIDEAMGRINPSYLALRQGGAVLEAPEVRILPEGAFDPYIKQGMDRRGQFKFRHIYPDWKLFIENTGLAEGDIQP